MHLIRWIIPALVASLILSTAGMVSAQEAGTVSGTVTDAQARRRRESMCRTREAPWWTSPSDRRTPMWKL